ncbi:MAG: hypothetical protein K8T90_13290 [Planctomycetes bacterium]|nr:hypothetical protein [Planctomycetota bacterium]
MSRRPRRLAVAILTALAALGSALPACGPTLPDADAVEAAYADVRRIAVEAQGDYESGRWADAADGYRRQIEATGSAERLAGWRDQAAYNLACVEARAGRRSEAAKAFAQSVAHGLRPVQVPVAEGRWTPLDTGLSIPHILADPDLDAIREEPAYIEAMKAYVAVGEPIVDFDHGVPGGPVPFLFWLRGDSKVEWPQWRFGTRGAALAYQHGTIALQGSATTPYDWHWLLADGDTRWAVASVRRTLDVLPTVTPAAVGGNWVFDGPRIYDLDSVYLVAFEPEAATAALAAALEMPERIAGFVAIGAKQSVPTIADALAAVATKRAGKPAWKVIVGESDDALAASLTAAGATVVRAKHDAASQAAIDLWLQ